MKKRQINKRGPLDKYLGGPTEATDTSQPPKEATPKDDATWWLTVYLSERSQSRDDIIPDYLEDELSQAIALKVAYEETYWRMFRKELPHLINLDPRQVLFDEIRHIVKEYNELAGRLDPTSTS
jgi:rubrerythrin